jgi:hypothetical protein
MEPLVIAGTALAITMSSAVAYAGIACLGGGPEIQCPYKVASFPAGLNNCCADYCSNAALNGYESCVAHNQGTDEYCGYEGSLLYNFCQQQDLALQPNNGNCHPTITCASTMSSCGAFYDDCGNLQNCGQCPGGWTCNASSMPGAAAAGYCTPPPCGFLASGQSLTVGQSVTSCNGQYTLIMQGDGNLVEYDPNCSSAICQMSDASANGGQKVQAIWASGTANTAAAVLTMQGDGNLVLSDENHTRAFWTTATYSNYVGCPASTPTTLPNGLWELVLTNCTGAYLEVQDDGNIVVHAQATGDPIWSAEGWLAPGAEILAGGWMYSYNGLYVLRMQGDGNLVLYDFAGLVLWATNTNSGTALVMQGDGNLVLQGTNWSSGTWDHPGSYLSLDSSSSILSIFQPFPQCWNWNVNPNGPVGTCYQSTWQNSGSTLNYSVPSGPLGATCPTCATSIFVTGG